MSYNFYHILHLTGLFMVILPLGAIAYNGIMGGTKSNLQSRKFFMAFHGTGLALVFIAGFGLMARGGFSFSSGWVYVKILAWLVLGAFPVIIYKQKKGNKIPFIGILLTLFIALLFVEYKFF